MLENPFILEPFKSKAYFCDREKETEEIIRNITNGRNTTLISPRRLGKTGLIFRVFDEMKERKLPYETIYCDISDTLSSFLWDCMFMKGSPASKASSTALKNISQRGL